LQGRSQLSEAAGIFLTTAGNDTAIKPCASDAALKKTTVERLLPRTGLFTEPIACSGAVAIPGRQSASALATQHALAAPTLRNLQAIADASDGRAANGRQVADDLRSCKFQIAELRFRKSQTRPD
jgi:hypothetical protein